MAEPATPTAPQPAPAPAPAPVPDPVPVSAPAEPAALPPVPKAPMTPAEAIEVLGLALAEARAAAALREAARARKFHLVVVDDATNARCREFDSVEDVIAFLRSDLLRPGVAVFLIEGERWWTTKGPNRRLLSPDKSAAYDLAGDPDDFEVDDTGALALTEDLRPIARAAAAG